MSKILGSECSECIKLYGHSEERCAFCEDKAYYRDGIVEEKIKIANKETYYMCFECGERLRYSDLRKILTMTENFKTEHYSHRCPKCKGNKFIILSIVERL